MCAIPSRPAASARAPPNSAPAAAGAHAAAGPLSLCSFREGTATRARGTAFGLLAYEYTIRSRSCGGYSVSRPSKQAISGGGSRNRPAFTVVTNRGRSASGGGRGEMRLAGGSGAGAGPTGGSAPAASSRGYERLMSRRAVNSARAMFGSEVASAPLCARYRVGRRRFVCKISFSLSLRSLKSSARENFGSKIVLGAGCGGPGAVSSPFCVSSCCSGLTTFTLRAGGGRGGEAVAGSRAGSSTVNALWSRGACTGGIAPHIPLAARVACSRVRVTASARAGGRRRGGPATTGQWSAAARRRTGTSYPPARPPAHTSFLHPNPGMRHTLSRKRPRGQWG